MSCHQAYTNICESVVFHKNPRSLDDRTVDDQPIYFTDTTIELEHKASDDQLDVRNLMKRADQIQKVTTNAQRGFRINDERHFWVLNILDNASYHVANNVCLNK